MAHATFDPVLAELVLRWYCPPGGSVLDPWAGDPVRGVVSAHLGLDYTGIELRQDHADAIMAAADPACASAIGFAQWLVGAPAGILKTDVPSRPEHGWDLLFTRVPCPGVSPKKGDAQSPADRPFHEAFELIRVGLRACVDAMDTDRFVVLVVQDGRGSPSGARFGLAAHLTVAMQKMGLQFWDHVVLVSPVKKTSADVKTRRMQQLHSDMLVFVKGNGYAAAKNAGPMEHGSGDAFPPERDALQEELARL